MIEMLLLQENVPLTPSPWDHSIGTLASIRSKQTYICRIYNMEDKIYDELQKVYDNNRLGALVQEICEYYATKGSYEDNAYEDEIEPPEIVESAYTLFCLQSREQILDEFAIVRKKYPAIYTKVADLHESLLVNMDYRTLEDSCAITIANLVDGTTVSDILGQVEACARSSENLSEGLDRFYKYLHSRKS